MDLKMTITITGKAGGNKATTSIDFDPPLDGSGNYDNSAVGQMAAKLMMTINPDFVRDMMGPVESSPQGNA